MRNKIHSYRILATVGLIFSGMLFSNSNVSKNDFKKKPIHPNIIFILTDDQGYGDMGCHGNPWIKTPNTDRLYSQSVRFTNFHVGTTCAPTRAGLMTGKYCNKVGVWHTIKGREILSSEETTLAESLKKVGYRTAIFGKWHLGDNYPYLPQYRGFDEVLIHGGGGVGQQPDYWDNDYFDDTYFHDGQPEKFNGYCTNIWFTEALKFIKKNKTTPFFCYLATNAPHSPFHVEKKYGYLYKNNPNIPNPNFYGMITNLDENLGKLRETLDSLGIAQNTILIFMTDNGTSGGVEFDEDGGVILGYNAGMRGKKGSPYDGGHRVPFFLHWPGGRIAIGKNISNITSYIDLMPTILDLCGVLSSTDISFDGISLKPLIYGKGGRWPKRVLFTDTQREEFLVKYKQFTAMTDRWRLVGKDELYDILTDPGQENNVAGEHPEIVKRLLSAYEKWWTDVSWNADQYNYIKIGAIENPVRLNSHDCHMKEGMPAWSQYMVRNAEGENGFWAVEIVQSGKYEFELYRWPKESHLRLNDPAPEGEKIPGGKAYPEGKALTINKARIKIGGQELYKEVSDSDSYASFTLELKKGTYKLECRFIDAENIDRDSYYVYVNYLKM